MFGPEWPAVYAIVRGGRLCSLFPQLRTTKGSQDQITTMIRGDHVDELETCVIRVIVYYTYYIAGEWCSVRKYAVIWWAVCYHFHCLVETQITHIYNRLLIMNLSLFNTCGWITVLIIFRIHVVHVAEPSQLPVMDDTPYSHSTICLMMVPIPHQWVLPDT